jgi:hypothetical protein
VALIMMLKTLYRTSIFGCFELRFSPLSTFCFRKKTSSSPLRIGENQSLFVLLMTVKLVRFRFCWPTKLCATQCAEFIHFSFAVFR